MAEKPLGITGTADVGIMKLRKRKCILVPATKAVSSEPRTKPGTILVKSHYQVS